MSHAPLERGISVVAPASAPYDPERLPAGLARLRACGLEAEARRPLDPYGYLAGEDQDRLDELNTAIRDPEAGVLWAVRGGYGTLRLLDQVDYEAARLHPKILVGYSDLTALQLALFHRSGWQSLSGPMLGVEFGSVRQSLAGETLDYLHGRIPELPSDLDESLESLVPGTAEGVLLGGNLSMIAKLVGTPYLPDLSGCILFLEDVGEPAYRLDGLLAQLRLAGHLDGLGGVALGGFTGADEKPDRPQLALSEVFAHYFGRADYPVLSGLAYGHFPEKRAMPLGVRARLVASPDACSLTVLEPFRSR